MSFVRPMHQVRTFFPLLYSAQSITHLDTARDHLPQEPDNGWRRGAAAAAGAGVAAGDACLPVGSWLDVCNWRPRSLVNDNDRMILIGALAPMLV